MLGSFPRSGKRKAKVADDNDSGACIQPGSRRWFRETKGLNDSAYIPGVDLLETIMSKEKVVAAWRKKNLHNGFRYRRYMSNMQARRMRYLY
jgi:hypothetical protein